MIDIGDMGVGEGVGENLLVELTSFRLVEYSVDEKFSTKCFDKTFVDEMLLDKSVIRRKA